MQELLAPPPAQTDDRLGRFLWRLIEASPVAVVAVDQDGAILYANQKLAEMFHYPGQRSDGQPHRNLASPNAIAATIASIAASLPKTLTSRPMGSGLDLAGRRSDGSEFPIEVGLSYFRSGDVLIVLARLPTSRGASRPRRFSNAASRSAPTRSNAAAGSPTACATSCRCSTPTARCRRFWTSSWRRPASCCSRRQRHLSAPGRRRQATPAFRPASAFRQAQLAPHRAQTPHR